MYAPSQTRSPALMLQAWLNHWRHKKKFASEITAQGGAIIRLLPIKLAAAFSSTKAKISLDAAGNLVAEPM